MDDYMKEAAVESAILNGELPQLTLTTGKKVVIFKCKVKQIGTVLRFLGFLMKSIGMKDLNDKPDMDLSNPTELMMLIADGSDQIYPVAVALCDLDMDQFQDLDIEDAMAIMMAEWELNKSFFLQRVMPMLGSPNQAKSPTSKASKKPRSTRKRKAT